jgi:hypothetical protein
MLTFFSNLSFVEGASVVRTDKEIYNQSEAIRIYFANAPGNDSDWMCIVHAGSPDTEAGDYKYMPRGLGQGFLIFDPRSPGEYEVRAYYNYRRTGYVVSGRHAFSVVSDPINEEVLSQYEEPIEPNNFLEANLPPPIPFAAPPELIVLPDTYVYVVPDVDVDIFFYDGWWWRPWEGRWYRSRYYNRGWDYYNNVPHFYFDIDPGWRRYYRDRNWYGHRWDYERIPNQRLQQNWKGWQNDRRWERHGTWGIQNYQPRPQQQKQELRQQRRLQYQQLPDVQKQRQQPQKQPQVQQPKQQPQERGQRPQTLEQKTQIQQPGQQPQVQQTKQQPQERGQRPQKQEQKAQIQQPGQQPQVQQSKQQPQERVQRPQTQEQKTQVQQPGQQSQVQQTKQQPQERVQRPQKQEQRTQVQQPKQQLREKDQQPQRSQPQGKPEREEKEKQDRK